MRREAGDLLDIVRVSSRTPDTGERFAIESTIINTGDSTRTIVAHTCDLYVLSTPDLELDDRQIRCDGYSGEFVLAPGDSLMFPGRGRHHAAGGVMTSGPGIYLVRVRHLVEPELWVEFAITVN